MAEISDADLAELDRYFTAMQSGGAKVLSNASQARKILDRVKAEPVPAPTPAPAPAWRTLDLRAHDGAFIQVYAAPEPAGELSIVNVDGTDRVRVEINGSPEGSLNGGFYRYGSSRIGESE